MKAAPSSRAYDRAALTYGLFSIPLAIYSAKYNDHKITTNWFSQDDHEVGLMKYDKVTGAEIQTADVVTKVATEYGHVHVTDTEIEKLFEISPHSLDMQSVQPAALLGDTYVPKDRYFVEVDKVKKGSKKIVNTKGVEALAAILEALRERDAMMLVEFTTRGAPRPAVLLGDGTLWTLYWDEELREQRPMPEVEVTATNLTQARGLIELLWTTTPAELSDERTLLIRQFAEDKAKAKDFGKPTDDEVVVEPVVDEANDLMAMLTASVTAAKGSDATAKVSKKTAPKTKKTTAA